ncbi:hypothetical protein [Brevibacillus sp. SYSU BS000544]|uniref:hypothetical protein n=1 Tax=Brevibacillus sp. SYSU BS000544 TaxID=3416443 RepID=UPI003CE50FE7
MFEYNRIEENNVYPLVYSAVDVPVQTTISVKWKNRRDNGGINVYYADDPTINE